MRRRYALLSVALLYLGSACMQDPEAPHNQPDTPTLSVDETSVTRVSMLVNGSFGHDLTDITSYGVELSTTLFEHGGEVQTLTPQEVGADGYALGVSGLSPNETYYLRAFISNGHSKMYSSVITQKTPETSVASVSDVTLSADGAYMTATIEDNGGRSVEEVGFVWGEQNDRRAIRREKRYPATIGQDGRFSLSLSLLGPGTHYLLAYAEDNKEATGFSRIALEKIVEEEVQPAGQPSNEIWYTSTDGEIVTPYSPDAFNSSIVSNTYENGKGVMVFEEPLTIIGRDAFWGCGFTSIQLPKALQEIEDETFGACQYLETLDIPQSVTSISKYRVFSQCSNLSSFTGKFATEDHRSLVIDGVMVGFAQNGLTEYSIDSSVKEVGCVFEGCFNLERINLPEGLTTIYVCAFEGCRALKRMDLPSSLRSIDEHAFRDCNGLTTMYIPQSVTSIKETAFDNCSSLQSFSGNFASEDGHCLVSNNNLLGIAIAGLEEYSIPEGITTSCHVMGFSGLKRIVFPETISTMGQVYQCNNLESIVVKAKTPPSAIIHYYPNYEADFIHLTNNCPIYVPAESVDAYKSAEYWSDYADRIQPIPGDISPNKYLTFTSEGTTKLSLSNQGYAPVLYYSFDTTSWTQWDYGELSFAADKPLYICGDNANGLCPDSNVYTVNVFTASGDLFAVSGDIMSLLNKDEDMTAIPGHPLSSAISSCFYGLFRDCTILTSGPSLPASQLTPLCYSYMFSGCTALKVAPELPATIISTRCYDHMFEGCSALTEAPALSANSLAAGCYANMFQDCTGLSSAPELPATTLTGYCYDNMFQGCTRLTAAPVLPATAIDMYSYRGMFSGCTSLVTPPELPATSFKSFECYEEMFKGCTSLATAPALPVTELTIGCYANMFKDCTSLRTAPELPAEVLVRDCYYGMFENCSKLNYVKCLVKEVNNSANLNRWLYGVASSGTFVKSANASNWPAGSSGIPEGWAVINDGETPGGGNEGTGEEPWN